MDEIKNMLKSMQEEMRQQKVDMLAMKEDIKNTINNNINEKFKYLETKNEILEQKLETQNIAISNFERFMRRKNLLFFGVEEREKSYQDLEKIVLDIIRNILNIECENNCIESTRRLGKKGEKIRPIVVTMLTMGLKLQIQKNKKKLETTPYYIKEDFPLEVLNKRKILQLEVEKEREQGRKAIIKYDKIVILNNSKQNTTPKEANNNKRNLSESPETISSSNQRVKQTTKQPTKINKTNNMDNFIVKKPAFTYPKEGSTSQNID